MNESFFQKIENKTGVSMSEIFALANAIQHADFTDEKQVRKIVKKVGKLAKKDVSKQLEDEIVKSIINKGHTLDVSQIQSMMNRDK